MDKDILIFQNRDIIVKIDISNVVYFEANGNFTNIVTRNKSTRSVYVNLGQMDSFLKYAMPDIAEKFVRIGRKHIVNLDYIHLIDTLKKEMILSDCSHFTFKLNCSKESLKTLRELLQKFTREKYLLIECGNSSSAKPAISDNI